NRAFEAGVLQRMVFDMNRQAFVAGIQTRALRHRPALEGAIELQTKVVMQAARLVHLDDEAVVGVRTAHVTVWLRGYAEIAFLPIARKLVGAVQGGLTRACGAAPPAAFRRLPRGPACGTLFFRLHDSPSDCC